MSTGCMAELRGEWAELVEEAAAVNAFTVELAALSEWELDGLLGYLRGAPALPFRYVALHAPAKSRRMPEAELVALLAGAPAWVQAIVVHPDTMEDVSRYAVLGRRLIVENMDARKDGGRTVEELAEVFAALPQAGFCFDIAHAHSVDPSLELASALLDAFRVRLRQVHLSSLDDDCRHVSLRAEDEDRFAPLLRRCRDIPWILEAPMAA